MKQQLAGAVVLVSLVTTGCAGPGAANRPTSSEEAPASAAKAALSPTEAREALRAADASMAEAMARQGSAEGITASAAEDALLLLDGHYTLRGTEAIRSRLTAEPLERDGALSAEALAWDVSADGRMGLTVGHVLLDSTVSGTPGGAGTTGASGATGSSPATGATGSSASTGESGAAGTSPATGAAGSSASTGASGSAGPSGATGSSTSTGATGASASTGTSAAGAPAAAPRLKPGKRYQRYLAVWTRTPDGPWRLAAAVYGRSPGPLKVPPGFAFAPASATPATPAAPSDVLAEAFAADSAFSEQSVREGMGVAFGAWAAPDAVIPSGPSGFFGHEAIASGYAPFTREKVDLRWEPKLGGAAGSGDMAYTVGRAISVSPGPDGKPATAYLKYLSVWRRQPDGQWRYVADSGNGNPGPEGP